MPVYYVLALNPLIYFPVTCLSVCVDLSLTIQFIYIIHVSKLSTLFISIVYYLDLAIRSHLFQQLCRQPMSTNHLCRRHLPLCLRCFDSLALESCRFAGPQPICFAHLCTLPESPNLLASHCITFRSEDICLLALRLSPSVYFNILLK